MTTLQYLDKPFVFKKKIDHWPASSWTPENLGTVLGDMRVKFRIGKKCSRDVQWEGDCDFVEATVQQFCEWVDDQVPVQDNNPLNLFNRTSHWCYADYNYMKTLFLNHPQLIEGVDWSVFGYPSRDGMDSTFWMGSAGAHTVCHYDTYGYNLVAQLYGRKRWVLWSPEETEKMEPTRLPYEESSVFSAVHVHNPDLNRHSMFKNTTPHVVTLEPGDVLFVPRHWWHYVVSLETSISVNTWLELDSDNEARMSEAITRTMMCSFLGDASQETWLNPTEVCTDFDTNLRYLNEAAQSLRRARSIHTQYSPEGTRNTGRGDGNDVIVTSSKQPNTSDSSLDCKEMFRKLNLADYVQVTPCSFDEFLTSTLMHCTVCSAKEKAMEYNSDEAPEKKQKLDTKSHVIRTGNHMTSDSNSEEYSDSKRNSLGHSSVEQGHHSSGDSSSVEGRVEVTEVRRTGFSKINVELLAECVTHPDVVALVSNLLQQKLKI